MNYKTSGKYRIAGAIGSFVPFTIFVNADNEELARDVARDKLYSDGFEHVHIRKVEIAKPSYWVTMTDKFMSGWGMAKNKINKLVLSCNTYEEALIAERHAKNRDEMRYVNICVNKPRYNDRDYFVSWHGREQGDYDSWFEEK